jgi:crotonobetainyl-CoA:carnitine CoA-transferase CaiB-like acyl-CoA transferase
MQLTKILQQSKIPAYPVMGALDLVNDENLNSLHRSSLTVTDNNFSLDSVYRGVIWKLEKGQGEISGPTPSTGADNDEILIDLLGYEEEKVIKFRSNGII